MNQELIKKELTQLEKDILLIISTSEISSAKEISNILEIEETKVITILNNDEFYNHICANSLNNMRLAYHSKAIPKLIDNLDNEHKFYDSYDRLTKAIGAVKERDNESLKVSLEVLLKEPRIEKSVNHKSQVTSHTKENDKVSGNIFEVEDIKETKPSHNKKDLEFIWEEEE